MPIESELREDGQVSYFKISDPWTLEEMFKGFAQATANRDSVHQQDSTRRVHTLIDLMATKQAPPGVMQGRNLPALSHATRGEIVVAVKNEYPRAITKTMLKVMHVEGHFFESLDEAWEYLRTILKDPTVKADTDNESTR
jgi:hypothetical protein